MNRPGQPGWLENGLAGLAGQKGMVAGRPGRPVPIWWPGWLAGRKRPALAELAADGPRLAGLAGLAAKEGCWPRLAWLAGRRPSLAGLAGLADLAGKGGSWPAWLAGRPLGTAWPAWLAWPKNGLPVQKTAWLAGRRGVRCSLRMERIPPAARPSAAHVHTYRLQVRTAA